MKKARQSRNTWTKRIPAIAVLLVSAMLCVLAVVYRGVEVTQVSVDDGGIWVTNQDRKLVGHLNYDSLMLDGTVAVKSASFDIGQAGGDVTHGLPRAADLLLHRAGGDAARESDPGPGRTRPGGARPQRGAPVGWQGRRTRVDVLHARGRRSQGPQRRRRDRVPLGQDLRLLSRFLHAGDDGTGGPDVALQDHRDQGIPGAGSPLDHRGWR